MSVSVLVIVPALLAQLTFLALQLPHLIDAARDAAENATGRSGNDVDAFSAIADGFNAFMLSIPVVGFFVIIGSWLRTLVISIVRLRRQAKLRKHTEHAALAARDPQLMALLEKLELRWLLEALPEHLTAARTNSLSHEQFLARALAHEVNSRDQDRDVVHEFGYETDAVGPGCGCGQLPEHRATPTYHRVPVRFAR